MALSDFLKIIESMPKYKYNFKTKPYNHQLASMGAMLNYFSQGNKEFAL